CHAHGPFIPYTEYPVGQQWLSKSYHRSCDSSRTRWAYQNRNVILLRSDLHDVWDSCKFAAYPDRGHVVIPFVPGYDNIAGKILKLDHITDHNSRPLLTTFSVTIFFRPC
ncbi:hypothetical protein V8E53_007760, partial [Lactarius tabidus]